MLTLPIKKKWFDMILSGEKKEEYRDNKHYYRQRFCNLFGVIFHKNEIINCKNAGIDECSKDEIQEICFRNGYSKDSPSFVAKCRLRIGTGKEKWGAVHGTEYLILEIQEVHP